MTAPATAARGHVARARVATGWPGASRSLKEAATEGTRGPGGIGTPCQQKRRKATLRGTMHSALREHQHRLNKEVPHSHHCVRESPALPWDRCGLAPPCTRPPSRQRCGRSRGRRCCRAGFSSVGQCGSDRGNGSAVTKHIKPTGKMAGMITSSIVIDGTQGYTTGSVLMLTTTGKVHTDEGEGLPE
jgi:hypothetical protein